MKCKNTTKEHNKLPASAFFLRLDILLPMTELELLVRPVLFELSESSVGVTGVFEAFLFLVERDLPLGFGV